MSQPADAGGAAHNASIHVQENDPQQSPEDAYAEAVNKDPKNAPGPQTAEANWSELAPGDNSTAAQVAETFGGDQVVQQGETPAEPAEVIAQREDANDSHGAGVDYDPRPEESADDYPADDL